MPRRTADHFLVTLLRWATPLAACVVLALVLARVNGGGHANPPLPEGPSLADLAREPLGRSTEALVESLQAAVRVNPGDAAGYAMLGNAYYQRARETGDPAYYTRSQGSFQEALRLDPKNVTATIGIGTLSLARHDFRAGLMYGERAARLTPDLVRPLTVISDAQVELGRYGEAARTLERMARLKPTLATYSRVSYYRELHGDLRSATGAMRLAVAAGGGSPENAAYVQALLGNLQFDRGHYAAAEHAYEEARAVDPSYLQAEAGLARLDAGRGRFDKAINRYRRVVERLPLPEYAIALAETEQAAGERPGARRDFGLVHAEVRLLQANGVNTDGDLALFEANHGDAARAVALGRGAWDAAPSVRSADALSWALYKDGRIRAAGRVSERAMKLGSRDPYFLYHAGTIAAGGGKDDLARRLLGRLLRESPRFSPLYAPRARTTLNGLRP